MSDGSSFRVLKTYFEPAALASVLAEAGFEPRITTTEQYFIYGEAFVPKEFPS